MTIESLKYFFYIAEGNTFLEASEQFNISQSSLSKAIRQLEEELHLSLFNRSHRRAKMTPAGEFLYASLQDIAPAFREMMNQLQAYSICSSITCCAVPSLGPMYLHQFLKDFSQTHPEITVDITCSYFYSDALNMLRRRSCIFGILHQPLNPDFSYSFTPLRDDYLVAMLPQSHPLSGHETVSIKDIMKETILLNEWTGNIVETFCTLENITLKCDISKDSRFSIIMNVAAGNGISLFYASDIHPFKLDKVAVLPINDFPHIPISLAMLKNHTVTKSEQIFLDALFSYCASAFKPANDTASK